VLGNRLGATLVESGHPQWQRDPDLEQMNPDFGAGLARLVPLLMPDILFRLGPDGTPLFKEFKTRPAAPAETTSSSRMRRKRPFVRVTAPKRRG
jgi:hypothetical protein